MAFGLTVSRYRRLLVFLAYPYRAGLTTVQWTALLLASALLPPFVPATLAKPQLGLLILFVLLPGVIGHAFLPSSPLENEPVGAARASRVLPPAGLAMDSRNRVDIVSRAPSFELARYCRWQSW
ncbi:MAG TPA: hypothetical protein VNO32_62165 [Candidatus Acidoferrum sp.]|nr:hypothetical protein [Candidatus Acidoferrum sp.]